jgi:hypothetical protein
MDSTDAWLVGIFAAFIVAIGAIVWLDMHDGKRCVEQRFSHFSPIVGPKGMAGVVPVYVCIQYVADPNS